VLVLPENWCIRFIQFFFSALMLICHSKVLYPLLILIQVVQLANATEDIIQARITRIQASAHTQVVNQLMWLIPLVSTTVVTLSTPMHQSPRFRLFSQLSHLAL
jgi:hypothetical protein